MEQKKQTITIVGAGLGGCFLALLFAKRGYKVELYERGSHEEIVSNASKRSFTLTIYGYGIQAIRDAGLWEAVEPILIVLEASVTYVRQNSNAKPIIAPSGSKDMPFYGVQRSKLLEVLIKEAQKNPLISFHFETELISIDRYEHTMIVQNVSSKKHTTVSCDVIFGADGINSKVRSMLQHGQAAKHHQQYASWGYKQIEIGKEFADKLELKGTFSYTWTGKNAIFIAYSNGDGNFSGLFILPKDKEKGFAALHSETAIKHFFETYFAGLLPMLPAITKSVLRNPEGSFVMVTTSPWYYKDFMAIIGDGAHGVFPFYGQGTSAAFGDAMEIARLVDIHGTDWKTIFPIYQKNRKKNMDALAELSKESFYQYQRQTRANYAAIYNKFDALLYQFFPGLFQPPAIFRAAIDQNNIAELVEKHKKQRKKIAFLGIPLVVAAITGFVYLHEKISKLKD
jgi:kynurenine 3-monooxygenase